MIESCFMFACLARMRVSSFVFPGRLRFAGNIFMTRGCLLAWPHVAHAMCVTYGLFGARRCISSRENTDRCTMQAEGAHQRTARNGGVKLWSETGIVIYSLRPDFPKIPSSALRHAHRSRASRRVHRDAESARVWSDMGKYTRVMQPPAGMCFLTLSLICVAENFPLAIYRVYVPRTSLATCNLWSAPVSVKSCYYCLCERNGENVTYHLINRPW